MTYNAIKISPRSRFRAAMVLAIIADALQIAVFPLFVEGAESPADDILDFGIGAVLVYLLGWHWEFLPSFLGKLVPGVDLVPFWTMAVANVYRKSKNTPVTIEGTRVEQPTRIDPRIGKPCTPCRWGPPMPFAGRSTAFMLRLPRILSPQACQSSSLASAP